MSNKEVRGEKEQGFSLAIMGTRGIPAAYGGFETFAEELSIRLVARGHRVTVFGRRSFFQSPQGPPEYKGVLRASSPTIFHKYLETPLSFLTAVLGLLGQPKQYDCILLCNAANSPFAWIARLLGIPVLINVDGIERLRAKWNIFGRLWYLLGERCAVLFASRIISDAQVIAKYYKEAYGAESQVIAYGANAKRCEAGRTLQEFQLGPRGYILYVSRLEPENNALGVIEAYISSGLQIPLVIVGDAPYASVYKEKLQQSAQGRNIIFTGYQFGEAYRELQSNCLLYVQATEVGGTHPALIEAMAYGNCILANGTPENIEVLGDAGLLYEKNNFAQLGNLLGEIAQDVPRQEDFRKRAQARAVEKYDWDKVVLAYEQLIKLNNIN